MTHGMEEGIGYAFTLERCSLLSLDLKDSDWVAHLHHLLSSFPQMLTTAATPDSQSAVTSGGDTSGGCPCPWHGAGQAGGLQPPPALGYTEAQPGRPPPQI